MQEGGYCFVNVEAHGGKVRTFLFRTEERGRRFFDDLSGRLLGGDSPVTVETESRSPTSDLGERRRKTAQNVYIQLEDDTGERVTLALATIMFVDFVSQTSMREHFEMNRPIQVLQTRLQEQAERAMRDARGGTDAGFRT